MALSRRGLAAERDCSFWKLCGSGTGEGFTPRPNWGVWAILAVWPDPDTARDRTTHGRIFRRWADRADEHTTLHLSALSSRGHWTGHQPFAATGSAAGPLAALTRATIRRRHLLRFWSRVPDISAAIGADPNVAFKIGIGEMPWLHQVTFSIWPDADAMAAFARAGGPHAAAIRAVRDGDWFSEDLYARFSVIGATGTWGGRPPLSQLNEAA